MKKTKTKAKPFSTIPRGTKVHWKYRGAIGHGTVVGIASKGTSNKTTRYKVRQHDYHPGEKAILIHTGAALKRG